EGIRIPTIAEAGWPGSVNGFERGASAAMCARSRRHGLSSGVEPEQAGPMSADIETLRRILSECRTIAVVGLSADWYRPSYFAAKYMMEHGYRIIPVNPRYDEILGEPCYPSVADVPVPIDMVDVFRRPSDVEPIARQAIDAGARCLWQQLGVVNERAHAMAREAGLDSVMDRCVKIEHARLFGGLNWVGVNTGVISARRPRILPY